MNKEELLKEFNAKVNKLTQELLAKLKQEDKEDNEDNEEKKPFEVELPKVNDIVYYICEDRDTVDSTYFYSGSYFKNKFLNGHYFETREEAEQRLKEQKLLFKIKKWAEIHNEGWKPDWSDLDSYKYMITRNSEDSTLRVRSWSWTDHMSVLPCFKSSEIAEKCIKEFGEEIKEILL